MSSPVPWHDVRSRLTAAALLAADHVQWPNEPFQLPAAELWLSVDITGTTLQPIELGGSGMWQEEGVLYVRVIVPAFSGTDAARTMAKAIMTVFRNLPPGPVVYYGGSIGFGVHATISR